ncbi:hypothetical protein LY76DRAFT_592620 [Colletotrichum caudatum]|nr:hypothetical protein LY76DRAFT_592620 [Colletotrichum caudatum]
MYSNAADTESRFACQMLLTAPIRSWRRNSFAKAFAEQLRPACLGDSRGAEAGASSSKSNSPRLTASPSSSCLLGNIRTWLTVPSTLKAEAEGRSSSWAWIRTPLSTGLV